MATSFRRASSSCSFHPPVIFPIFSRVLTTEEKRVSCMLRVTQEINKSNTFSGWHNRAVPRLTNPPGMPEEVARVVEIISNAVRTEILHFLSREALTAMEISQLTGVIHSSIHRHLVMLEDAGLVKADHEPHRRRGREVRWSADVPRIESVAATWAAYASGRSSQP